MKRAIYLDYDARNYALCNPFAGNDGLDIPDEFIQRYEVAQAEFDAVQNILGHNEGRAEWECPPGSPAPVTDDIDGRIAALLEKITRHVGELRGPNDWDVHSWVRIYDGMNAELAGLREAQKSTPETP